MREEEPTDDLLPAAPVLRAALQNRLDEGACFIDEHHHELTSVEEILMALRRHGRVYGRWSNVHRRRPDPDVTSVAPRPK